MTAAKMTPQQALGEALACLERARDLLGIAAIRLPTLEAQHAAHLALHETRGAVVMAQSARALDEAGK